MYALPCLFFTRFAKPFSSHVSCIFLQLQAAHASVWPRQTEFGKASFIISISFKSSSVELRSREELLRHPVLCNMHHRILYKQRTKQTAPVRGSLRPQCDSRRSTEQSTTAACIKERELILICLTWFWMDRVTIRLNLLETVTHPIRTRSLSITEIQLKPRKSFVLKVLFRI